MKPQEFDDIVQSEAAAMATSLYGGSWETDFTDERKAVWCEKVSWAMQRYCGIDVSEVVVMYGDNNHKVIK